MSAYDIGIGLPVVYIMFKVFIRNHHTHFIEGAVHASERLSAGHNSSIAASSHSLS